jgi:hypothetical protein
VDLLIDGGASLGGTTISGQSLDATGQTTYTANFASAGTHQIVANYSGDSTHAVATGVGSIMVTGGAGKGSFTLAPSPSSLTISSGSTGNETLTATPAGGYTGTIAFTYSLSSTAINNSNFCIFVVSGFDTNGNLAVTGSSAVSGVLQIDTNGSDCTKTTGGAVTGHGMRMLPRTGSGVAANHKPNGSLPAGLAFAGLLLAGLLGRSSRKLRGLACVIGLGAVLFGLSACGSSSGGPANAPKGTYTVTFQGKDSVTATITAQTSFTVVVK